MQYYIDQRWDPIKFVLLSMSTNLLASWGIRNLTGDEPYSIQSPITNLSLTLEQGSIISSFAAIRATQPSTTWLRYTRGVLPIIYIGTALNQNTALSQLFTRMVLKEWHNTAHLSDISRNKGVPFRHARHSTIWNSRFSQHQTIRDRNTIWFL